MTTDGGPRQFEKDWDSDTQGKHQFGKVKKAAIIAAIAAASIGAGVGAASCGGGHPCCPPFGAGVCNPC